jgi:hypothetical protein
MARKRRPDLQLGLSLPAAPLPAVATPAVASSGSPADLGQAAKVDVEDFDDYDDHSGDTPRLRLVDPPASCPRVIVEVIGEGRYEVSRLRDNGTTVASVTWTREELEELIDRVRAALEVSR